MNETRGESGRQSRKKNERRQYRPLQSGDSPTLRTGILAKFSQPFASLDQQGVPKVRKRHQVETYEQGHFFDVEEGNQGPAPEILYKDVAFNSGESTERYASSALAEPLDFSSRDSRSAWGTTDRHTAADEQEEFLEFLEGEDHKVSSPGELHPPTLAERILDIVAAGIAFTVGFDAGLLKVVDNALKYRPSILARFTQGVLNVVKWLVVPGSIIIDTAMMIAKETSPPPKVEVRLHETSIEQDVKAKNREAFCDFWQAQGLGAVNRFA